MAEESNPRANRLIGASSPYLLQHAHNPVDWHLWDEEALATARRENRPILLSIGYSACHWCHVMEHESFEDPETAKLMNKHFVNIKVDREERPDLDAIYMNFVQMATGSGGWPLTVFLTPDLVPFFGGTYFPPRDQYGRPGFKRLLQVLAEAYRNRQAEIEKSRADIVRRLEEATRWRAGGGKIEEALLKEAHAGLRSQFDPRHGGFGQAPKFPASMALSFLLRYYRRSNTASALEMVRLSLDAMARGGLYDQLGGGFHRYSVDERWLVPHFEKMLYDNALLARVYLEAFQVTGEPHYREVVEETLGWVEREMLDPAGGFYSSLDADSEGEEGKYYVWRPEQVEAILGREEAALFNDYFDVTASGNFEGNNILHQRRDLKAFSQALRVPAAALKKRLDAARLKLRRAREQRIRPGLDNKVLAAWNGMMLTAFAEAAFVLKEDRFLETACRNADFLASQMLTEDGLCRSWKEGQAQLNGYLEDYALVIEGWLSTYQVSGRLRYLEQARRLQEAQFERFWDASSHNFYFTPEDHEPLLVRHREFMDNATPSGNSTSCLNLLRLGLLLDRSDYREKAERMLQAMATALTQHPSAFAYWLLAADFYLGPVLETVAVGPEAPERLLQPVRDRFLPNKIVVMARPGAEAPDIPLLRGKTPVDNQATLYLCRHYSCQEPATTREAVERQLQQLVDAEPSPPR